MPVSLELGPDGSAKVCGNFFTDAALVFPLGASVNGSAMPAPATYGGCNRRHGAGGGGG